MSPCEIGRSWFVARQRTARGAGPPKSATTATRKLFTREPLVKTIIIQVIHLPWLMILEPARNDTGGQGDETQTFTFTFAPRFPTEVFADVCTDAAEAISCIAASD